MLSRYEFEFLKYVEENGCTTIDIRTAADDLFISKNTIEGILLSFTTNGLVEEREKSIVITKKGIDLLEPYRVKRAIILAAGFGSRMMPATKDRPKPMVTVNGTRIIDTLIDSLVKKGIRDITIVRGYKKDCFEELYAKYPFVSFIDNDMYSSTNNISSMMLALDLLKDGCYLCEADLYISNPNVIAKYQYSSNILGSYSLETDDWSFKMKDGFISDYQKGNTYCYNYYGISFWTAEDCNKLREDFAKVWDMDGGKDYFWEFIPLVLCKENYQVEIRPCAKQDIIEIDNYHELALLDSSYKE